MDVTHSSALRGLELRTLVTADGRLELSLQEADVPEPGPNQVVMRVEGAPIHPSDIGLLLGPADLTTLVRTGSADRPVVSAAIPPERRERVALRVGQSLPAGTEGAGTVVKAGAGVEGMVGMTVTVAGGAMYAQYRLLNAADCVVLPPGTSAADGAACFVNPMTALSLVETLRMEGHKAMIHTAAASVLGQMLVRICAADGIPLVNVVRSPQQAALLRSLGAAYVVDSSSIGFAEDLANAIAETGATIAFDAVGGGDLVNSLLIGMDTAINRKVTTYSRYGNTTHKQVYIYGGLDSRPTVIDRSYGLYFGVSGFMLGPFLQKIGAGRARLQDRIVSELGTTFASSYVAEVSLAEALSPEVITAYARRATGEKYLINPAKGL